jgi:hypothetical protein
MPIHISQKLRTLNVSCIYNFQMKNLIKLIICLGQGEDDNNFLRKYNVFIIK